MGQPFTNQFKFIIFFGYLLVFPILGFTQGTSCFNLHIKNAPLIDLGCNKNCTNLEATLPNIRQTIDAANAYTVHSIPYSGHYSFNLPGATTILSDTDDTYSNIINLGFPFCFYGHTFNQVVIGSNGKITFDVNHANGYDAWHITGSLPNSAYAKNTIFALFMDIAGNLPGNNEGIQYKVVGQSPCRKLIVNWRNVPLYNNLVCPGQKATFQAVLYEGSNKIEVYVKERDLCIWNDGLGIIGLQNGSATHSIAAPGRNATTWQTTPPNSEAWQFLPNGNIMLQGGVSLLNASHSVIATASNLSTHGDTLIAQFSNICLGTQETSKTFFVKANYDLCANGTLSLIDTVTLEREITDTPIVNSPVDYCIHETATPLQATHNPGGILNWYTVPVGGTALPNAPTPSTNTPGSTTYYVSQTIDDTCESRRVPITVMVHDNSYTTLNKRICDDDSYSFGGRSYSSPGTYYDTLTSAFGCDSIVTLHLSVNPPIPNSNIYDTICSGDSYPFGGHHYSTVGTYNHTFTTSLGCDSTVTLHLYVWPAIANTDIYDSICQGGHYHFGGRNYHSTGNYSHIFQNDNGCDSTVILHLTVLPNSQTSRRDTICAGDTLHFFSRVLNQSGNYSETLQAVNGCDSTITLHLFVRPRVHTQINETICHGETFNFNGRVLNATGVYHDTLSDRFGCDSTVRLNLTVWHVIQDTTVTDTICDGDSLYFGGQYYNSAGAYTHTFQNPFSCDSTVTLNLSIIPPIPPTDTIDTICEGEPYIFGGVNLDTTGIYVDTFQTKFGCDSVVTLHLLVIPQYTPIIRDTICSGDTAHYFHQNFTVAGTYRDTLISTTDCDSIITLILRVNPSPSTTLHETICHGETYLFDGQTLTTSGIYHDTLQTLFGCDSFVILHLNVLPTIPPDTVADVICDGNSIHFGGQTYSSSGNYTHTFQTPNGCDSIVTLQLTVLPSIPDTTIVDTICEGQQVSFGGGFVHQTGYYSHLYSSYQGCDSMVHLDLTVLQQLYSTLRDTICMGDTAHYFGRDFVSAGIYRDTLISAFGCDSIITLHLVTLNTANITLNDTLCHGETYSFGGQNLNSSGTYYDTLQSVFGCDSFVTLHLTVLPAISPQVVKDTVCNGQTIYFGGQTYSTTGSYSHTFITSNGCDSVVTLDLQVLPTIPPTILYDTICHGTPYVFGGQNLTRTGTYHDTLASIHGCDSMVSLHLQITPISKTVIPATICEGDSFIFDGHVYYSSGNYVDSLIATSGCDSFVTLSLVVLPTQFTTINDTICAGDSYNFNGQIIDTTGIYVDTLATLVNGCDSIVTLNLTVGPISNTIIKDTICADDSVSFAGHSLHTAGIYYDTLSNRFGCDSIIELQLLVNPIFDTVLTKKICRGDTFYFRGHPITQQGIYHDTLQSVFGCDSFITLNLTVDTLILTPLSDSICRGDTFNFNGQILTSSGTYSDSLTSYFGCDSVVTLTLTVLPIPVTSSHDTICAGDTLYFHGQALSSNGQYHDTLTTIFGCDSIVTIHLTVLPPVSNTIIKDTICDGSTYLFGGQAYSTTGIYYDTLGNWFGCDSVIELHLEVMPSPTTIMYDTICHGDTFNFRGQNINTTGIYQDTLATVFGCDSVIELHLNVLPPVPNTIISDSICDGDTVHFGGQIYSTTGVYYDTLGNWFGCDSVVELHLEVMPSPTTVLYDTICHEDSFNFNGQILNTTGIYQDTLSTAFGCDSAVILHLTVLPAVPNTLLKDTVCSGDTVHFGGQTYSTTGVYYDTLGNWFGCDSVVELHLNVLPPVPNTIIEDTICDGNTYHFGGQTYNTTGTYYDTLGNWFGCDSVIELHLTVMPSPTTILHDSICDGDTFNFRGRLINTTGVYHDTLNTFYGCDSILELHLEIMSSPKTILHDTICDGDSINFLGQIIYTAGIFHDTLSTHFGCDSVITLNLTVIPPVPLTIIKDTICNGDTYNFGGQTYDTTGIYHDTLNNWFGCDSVIELQLVELPPVQGTTLIDTICDEDTFNFYGQNLNTTGIYTHTLQTAFGCDSIITLNLWVRQPVDTTFIDTVICYGESVTFYGQPYNASTITSHMLTDVHGCDSVITLHLKVLPKPVKIMDTLRACKRVSFHNTLFTADTTIVDTLRAQSASCDSIYYYTSIVIRDIPIFKDTDYAAICVGQTYNYRGHQLSEQDVYQYREINKTECDTVFTLDLTVNPLPNIGIEILTDGMLCIGEKIKVKATGAERYQWFSHNFVLGEGDIIHYKMEGENDYLNVKGISSAGCVDTASINLTGRHCCDGKLFMPNAFTPNGDGINDRFGTSPKFFPKKYHLVIYNRLGQKVFETSNPRDLWDGTYNGHTADGGVYFYLVMGQCNNGTYFKQKGDVTLIR